MLVGEITGEKQTITLDAALGQYVVEHARYLPSLQTIRYQAKSLLRLIGKQVLLATIDDSTISRFVARRRGERAKRGRSSRKNTGSVQMDRLVNNATVNRELGLLRTVMIRGRDSWKYDVGTVDWKRHRLLESDSRTRWLTPEQATLVMNVAAPHLRGPLLASLCTGLRASNVMRLDWSEIDLQQRAITVRVKSKRPGGKLLILPIAQPLLVLLANLSPKSDGRVFLYRGRPIKTDVRRAFLTALKRAKIQGKFTWHDLRHTAASWMVQRGVPLTTVKEVLGHSDIKLTQRYAHAGDQQIAEAVGVLGSTLADTQLAQPLTKKSTSH